MNFLPIGMPKDIDKYFFNRENDIKRINTYIKMVEMDVPNQILITGNHGVGKSILLKKILKDQSENYLTV